MREIIFKSFVTSIQAPMACLAGPSHTKHPSPPRATYRHLLHPSAHTSSNPLRVVTHCDIDAAYARESHFVLCRSQPGSTEDSPRVEFEAARIHSADDVPLIVVQWETIIAVNYPARKYGIKRCSSMGLKEAKALCPHVVIVHTATYRPGEDESGYWEDANFHTHKVGDIIGL